jgi:hypothetical protein
MSCYLYMHNIKHTFKGTRLKHVEPEGYRVSDAIEKYVVLNVFLCIFITRSLRTFSFLALLHRNLIWRDPIARSQTMWKLTLSG